MDLVVQTLTIEESLRRDALAGPLFQSILGALDLFDVYIGSRLGSYDALLSPCPVGRSATHIVQIASLNRSKVVQPHSFLTLEEI